MLSEAKSLKDLLGENAIRALLISVSLVSGFAVGTSASSQEDSAEADIIFKGTVISSAPVRDEWFRWNVGFAARETRFKVISVLKGNLPGTTFLFRHFASPEESRHPGGNYPRYYEFKPAKSYLIYTKMAKGEAGIYRQLRHNFSFGGALLCLDSRPLTNRTLKDALWSELQILLSDTDTANVMYAIRRLDEMSREDAGDEWRIFDRAEAVVPVHSFMTSDNPELARLAITFVGTHNPHLADERTEFWLATVGAAEIPGLGKMDPNMINTGGDLYWPELLRIASGDADSEIRSLAIRAMGLVGNPALGRELGSWLADEDPQVRAAATVLLADFPGMESTEHLTRLVVDPDSTVRACVARAIGFSQQVELLGMIDTLLSDTDREVRRVASVVLLSFSAKDPAVAQVLQANREIVEFQPLFTNALASEQPKLYLDELASIVENRIRPENWNGGAAPDHVAWQILIKYLHAQPPTLLNSGTVDRYLDAIETIDNFGSSGPRDIYALYLLHGMTDRAKRFRELASKSSPFDLDSFFDQVDRNPSHNSLETK